MLPGIWNLSISTRAIVLIVSYWQYAWKHFYIRCHSAIKMLGLKVKQNTIVLIVWPTEVPLCSETSVTGSLYLQGVSHRSVHLEFLCARLAVLILNQESTAMNNTYTSVTIFRLFFSRFYHISVSLLTRLFVCLLVWHRNCLFSVICIRPTVRFTMYSTITKIYDRKTVGHVFKKLVQIKGKIQFFFNTVIFHRSSHFCH
jgi:hypothetical protein